MQKPRFQRYRAKAADADSDGARYTGRLRNFHGQEPGQLAVNHHDGGQLWAANQLRISGLTRPEPGQQHLKVTRYSSNDVRMTRSATPHRDAPATPPRTLLPRQSAMRLTPQMLLIARRGVTQPHGQSPTRRVDSDHTIDRER